MTTQMETMSEEVIVEEPNVEVSPENTSKQESLQKLENNINQEIESLRTRRKEYEDKSLSGDQEIREIQEQVRSLIDSRIQALKNKLRKLKRKSKLNELLNQFKGENFSQQQVLAKLKEERQLLSKNPTTNQEKIASLDQMIQQVERGMRLRESILKIIREESEKKSEVENEVESIISEAMAYFSNLWNEKSISVDQLRLILSSGEFINKKNEFLKKISESIKKELPTSEMEKAGFSEEEIAIFVSQYSEGVLLGLLLGSSGSENSDMFYAIEEFSKKLFRYQLIMSDFGLIQRKSETKKKEGEMKKRERETSKPAEPPSIDQIKDLVSRFELILEVSGKGSNTIKRYLQFLDITGNEEAFDTNIDYTSKENEKEATKRFIQLKVEEFIERSFPGVEVGSDLFRRISSSILKGYIKKLKLYFLYYLSTKPQEIQGISSEDFLMMNNSARILEEYLNSPGALALATETLTPQERATNENNKRLLENVKAFFEILIWRHDELEKEELPIDQILNYLLIEFIKESGNLEPTPNTSRESSFEKFILKQPNDKINNIAITIKEKRARLLNEVDGKSSERERGLSRLEKVKKIISSEIRKFFGVKQNLSPSQEKNLTDFILQSINFSSLEEFLQQKREDSLRSEIQKVLKSLDQTTLKNILGRPTLYERLKSYKKWSARKLAGVASSVYLATNLTGSANMSPQDLVLLSGVANSIERSPQEVREPLHLYREGERENSDRGLFMGIKIKQEGTGLVDYLPDGIYYLELKHNLRGDIPKFIQYRGKSLEVLDYRYLPKFKEVGYKEGVVLKIAEKIKKIPEDRVMIVYDQNSYYFIRLQESESSIIALNSIRGPVRGEEISQDLLISFIEEFNGEKISLESFSKEYDRRIASNTLNLNPQELETFNPAIIKTGRPLDPSINQTISDSIGNEDIRITHQDYFGVCLIASYTTAINSLLSASNQEGLDTRELGSFLASLYTGNLPYQKYFSFNDIEFRKLGYNPMNFDPKKYTDSILANASTIADLVFQDSTIDSRGISSLSMLGVEVNNPNLLENVQKNYQEELYLGQGVDPELNPNLVKNVDQVALEYLNFLKQNTSEKSRVVIFMNVGKSARWIKNPFGSLVKISEPWGRHAVNVIGVNVEEGYFLIADNNGDIGSAYFGSNLEEGTLPTVERVATDGNGGIYKINLKGEKEDIAEVLGNIYFAQVFTTLNK